MDLLKGQIALVTGASAGIGANFAKNLANKGLKVVACARRLEKLQELANQGRLRDFQTCQLNSK